MTRAKFTVKRLTPFMPELMEPGMKSSAVPAMI
jgi:hypothetical protein